MADFLKRSLSFVRFAHLGNKIIKMLHPQENKNKKNTLYDYKMFNKWSQVIIIYENKISTWYCGLPLTVTHGT